MGNILGHNAWATTPAASAQNIPHNDPAHAPVHNAVLTPSTLVASAQNVLHNPAPALRPPPLRPQPRPRVFPAMTLYPPLRTTPCPPPLRPQPRLKMSPITLAQFVVLLLQAKRWPLHPRHVQVLLPLAHRLCLWLKR